MTTMNKNLEKSTRGNSELKFYSRIFKSVISFFKKRNVPVNSSYETCTRTNKIATSAIFIFSSLLSSLFFLLEKYLGLGKNDLFRKLFLGTRRNCCRQTIRDAIDFDFQLNKSIVRQYFFFRKPIKNYSFNKKKLASEMETVKSLMKKIFNYLSSLRKKCCDKTTSYQNAEIKLQILF
jgi:hypothetical protein